MQSEKITKRLSRDSGYNRPKKTYQENMVGINRLLDWKTRGP